MRLATCLASLLLPWQFAVAQARADISDADLERVRRAQPVITEQDIERARKRHSMPDDKAPGILPPPGRTNIDALPAPAQGPGSTALDLEALGKGFASAAQEASSRFGLASGPALMVFVSLSMPEPTLRKLLEQGARAQATLFIRGLVDNSIRTTVTRVQDLIGQAPVAIQIDPQAFDRFGVERVPSFVLVRDGTRPASCASGVCSPPQAYVKVTGDVSIDYALDAMRRGAPGQSRDATPFLRRLRAN